MEQTEACPTFDAAATLVGSFPQREPEAVLGWIEASLGELPMWPQLPARDFRESMYIQYSEGFPGVILDAQAETLRFNTGEQLYEELERFYQAVVEEDVDHFAISREYALGLHLFFERFRARRPAWVKGQVTGPFSFAMTVTDEGKRSIAYHDELFEVTVQGIANKSRWMARELRRMSTSGAVIVLDEPYLCSFGSAFVNVPREKVIAAIGAAVAAIQQEGALAGLHCCGNTDWSLALETGIDLLNFDAFEHFEGLPLYPDALRAFVERGGVLCWGIVPTDEAARSTTAEELAERLKGYAAQLVAKGIDAERLYHQSIVTPACGVGTKPVDVAEAVMQRVVELSALVRERKTLA